MPDIKTRDVVKGTVKTLDKSAIASQRMKDAYVRTKEKAEHSVYAAESSPDEYAADRLSGGTETAARETAYQLTSRGARALKLPRRIYPRPKSISRKSVPPTR